MTSLGTTVPFFPPYIGAEGVWSGRPVRGGNAQWRGWALACNSLLGRGGTLIPHARCFTEIDQNATTTLHFVVSPRYAARRRVWAMTYGVTTAFAPCLIRFTDPSGGTSDATISAASSATVTHYHTEDVADVTATNLAPTWTEVSDVGAPKLLTVACFEMPRPEIAQDALEYGVNVDSFGQGRSVYTTTGVGPGALVTSVSQAWDLAPRNGLFHWARGQVDFLSMSSGSWTPVFAGSPILRGRKATTTSTTKTVNAQVRVSSGAGTTGTVRMTMASGAVVTFAISSAMAEAWVDNEIDIDCDDLSTADGRRSSRLDTCLFEWQRTGGANSINLHGISINNG